MTRELSLFYIIYCFTYTKIPCNYRGFVYDEIAQIILLLQNVFRMYEYLQPLAFQCYPDVKRKQVLYYLFYVW